MFRSSNKWLTAATGTGVCYALALLIFAGDVFNKNQGTSQTIFGLLIHFIATSIGLFVVMMAHYRSFFSYYCASAATVWVYHFCY